MSVCYYKRFRMEIDLRHAPAPPDLPEGYFWVPWDPAIVDTHAQVKFGCFHGELDARIFPCLGDRLGCQQLMREISKRRGFLPEATWLIGSSHGYVGTVQGVVQRLRQGMIQNLGVLPSARGQGLGTSLLLKALAGFRQTGLRRAILEVTAENQAALRPLRPHRVSAEADRLQSR